MATFEGILDTCIRVTTTGDTRVTTTGDVRITTNEGESALASDSLTVLWNAQGVLAESVGANDSISAVRYVYATISESVSASDALEIAWNAQGVVLESVTGNDSLLISWNALCELAESVGADDAYVLARIYDKIISESVGAADTLVNFIEIGVSIAESVAALETLTVDGVYKNAILVIEGNDTLAVGDILYIKEGTDAEWLEVANVVYAPSYRVIRDKAGDYADGSNPVWTQGASVVNYGQSGDGGIYITASDTNAPYLSVFTHAGEPWDTITTHIREGNLNGYAGYTTDVYGWASYIDANNYIKIDPVNGIRMSGEIVITNPGDIDLDDLTGTTKASILQTVVDAGYVKLLRRSATANQKLEITAGGIEGYANNVKNFELASGIAYLGDQANEHIKLSSSGMQIYDGATQLALFGATVLVGKTGANQSNVYIASGALHIRNNVADVITLAANGDVTITGRIIGATNLESTAAGDVLEYTDDVEGNYTATTTWTKVKEISVPRGGSLRIKFSLRAKGAGGNIYGRIYRNGTAVGTTRSSTSNTAVWVEHSEDISGWSAGDLLQLYAYTTNVADPAYYRGLRIYLANALSFSAIIV